MDFQLTDEQQAAKELAREIAEREILPVAAACDREHTFPGDIIEKVRQAGLYNYAVPEEYGGIGAGILIGVLVTEQFAWACAGIATSIAINSLAADPILVAGSEEQRRHYFAQVLLP